MRNNGKRLLALMMIVTMLLVSIPMEIFAQGILGGSGTQSSPYLIASSEDWDALSTSINSGSTEYAGKYFKLTDDITVTTVLGTRPGSSDSEDRPFIGTFDGAGHTLTVNYNKSGFVAPFAIAHNSTIENLKVKGTVKSTDNHASGLVGASKDVRLGDASYLNIKNVTISTDISCNSHVAGVIGHAHSATITMENVVFKGSISASSVQGGFIGWGGANQGRLFNCTLKDCMFAGTYKSGVAFNPVAYASGQGNVVLTNDFYTTKAPSGGNPITPTGSGSLKIIPGTRLISSASDWNEFADAVLAGETFENYLVKLTNDITVTRGIGSAIIESATAPVYPFSGTFDGCGHTLNFVPPADTEANYVAPFSIVKNATVTNLKVTGKVTAYNNISGLVGSLIGTLLIENVISDVDVSGNFVGGFIGHGSTGNITVRNSAYTGDLNGSTLAGGIICWRGPTAWDPSGVPAVHMENCLFAGRAIGTADFHPIGFTQQTNVPSGFTNMWSSVSPKNNSKGFYNYQYQGASYKPTVAVVTSKSDTSGTCPWMGYFDVTAFMPTEGALAEALNAWTGAEELFLLGDATANTTATVPAGSHTLDLNGHTFKASSAGYSVITVGSGAELVIDDTASGGKITGGSVGQNYGGGVTVDAGRLTLKGGAISGNVNIYSGIGNCGGGIHVKNSGQFYMEGGEISGNTSYVGGGICSDASDTTVSITGGVIRNNTTERFGSAVWAGRTDSATFRIGGNAEIVGNISKWTADKDGEATVNFTRLLLSGDPTIQGDWNANGTSSPNTHINFDNSGSGIQCIELDGELTNSTGTAKITISPIYRWSDLKNGQSFVFTKNWNQYMGTANPADYFKVDDSVSGVKIIRRNGEAAVAGSSVSGDLYITFDANEGEGTMEPQLVAGTTAALGENAFTREGYCFAGWNTKKDGSGTGYTDKASVTLTGDLTLYAQWKEAAACVISGETATNYGTITEAVNAWTDGSTLQLLADVTTGNTITVPSGEYTLDLNGYGIKMTGSGSVINAANGATLNVEDSNPDVVHRFTVANAKSNGAGLATFNDALTSGYKTFTGGYITGGSSREGGGIKVNGTANLFFNGGNIIGNQSSFMGAGIKADNNGDNANVNITVNGGAILYNTVNGYGAGICSDGAVRINGGTIAYNVASNNPGGIHSHYLYLNGGSIENNFAGAADYACGAHADHEVYLSGNPVVSGNLTNGNPVNLDWDRTELQHGHRINIVDALTEGAKIGVTIRVGDIGEFTSGWKDKMGDADPADYFTSDNADYIVTLDDSGEAYLRYPDVANVSAEGYEGDYDGEAHGITVTAPEGASIKYGTEEGSYTLDASPAYTNAGSYTVYYQVSQAKHTPVEGSAVVTINKINATVTITGHSATADYDGKAHSVDGYDFAADNELYTEADFTFNGRAEAVRTNKGVTQMGLAPEQFENTNANFATVTFVVSDGYITIDPIDVIVTISGHNETADYDGKAHTISGYDVSFSNALYTEADFTFSGNATAEITDAGTAKMGLASNQFANTNENFATVAFVVNDGTLTINPIDVTLTITGHTGTVDYDGEAHGVDGYDVAFGNPLYTEADFSFSGNAAAERTDAGTTQMGLAPSQFANTNANFATVTFAVTDGFVTIEPIDVTVTITGHNSTADYDGKAHSADGYDVAFANPLYTEADFSFSGRAEAVRTNIGTTEMGLAPEQFENLNANFKEVTFDVTDGFQTVNPVDAVITSAPHAKDTLDYNGKAQSLFVAGVAEGGTLYYALGKDMDTVPANKAFSTSVPTAKEIGNYYIWYKVIGDSNHNSLAPVVFKVTLADPNWVTISGKILNNDKTPLSGADVILMSGNQVVDTITSYENGEYFFTVPAGVYNIVVESNGVTLTNIANVTGDVTSDIVLPAPNTESTLEIIDSDKSIAVGGLEAEANAIRVKEGIPDSTTVLVSMTVKAIASGDTTGSQKIGASYDSDKYLEFYDLKVEKTIDTTTTTIDKSLTVLEIVIPCSFTTKKDLAVYSCDGSDLQTLTLSDSKEPGTYRVDEENGLIFIYTNSFSTVALSYRPYFSVMSDVKLGSYTGNVSVKLVKDSTGETFEINNVNLKDISFTGVPKGIYTMTVTWTDLVENTLTLPFTVK